MPTHETHHEDGYGSGSTRREQKSDDEARPIAAGRSHHVRAVVSYAGEGLNLSLHGKLRVHIIL